jgi:hypothetical protein
MPFHISRAAFCALLLPFAFGCTAERASAPARTATEQLLLSTAADRAAAQLSLAIPADTKVYVDRSYFQGYDDGYAMDAIRNQFLRQGLSLVDDRAQAQAIVTVASGALSTDQKSLLIGNSSPPATTPKLES